MEGGKEHEEQDHQIFFHIAAAPPPDPPPPPSSFSAATLASIFLLAARIISSLRFWSNAWRSALFALQARFWAGEGDDDGAGGESAAGEGESLVSLLSSLYRVMRSGWRGLGCCGCCREVLVLVGEVALGDWGRGGWKDWGG